MSPISRHALAAAALMAAAQAMPAAAEAAMLVGLTADNALVHIDTDSRKAMAPVRVTGADGRLLGIDQRPADGRLYGVTETGQIVMIEPASGKAVQVSRLNMAFDSGGRAVVDFNPMANRLRLMGMSGVNFRVNVDTGEVARDGEVKYQAGTPHSGTAPRVTAGAYTNSVAGTKATSLYTFDTLLAAYNLQAPPNDGVQQVKGMLGMSVSPSLAFDIMADGQGGNTGFVLEDGTLYGIDLADGKLMAAGKVAGLPASPVIDIAAMR